MTSNNNKQRREARALAERLHIPFCEALRRVRIRRMDAVFGPLSGAPLVPHGARQMAHLFGKRGDDLYRGDGAKVTIRLNDPDGWDDVLDVLICAFHGSSKKDRSYAVELLTDRIYEARHEYLWLKHFPSKAKRAYHRHWGHDEMCDCAFCKHDRAAEGSRAPRRLARE